MLDEYFYKNVRYYGAYQVLFVSIFIVFSSIGVFFHFLLNHEMSIVEGWLHHNHWEILVLSKLSSLFVLNRWFVIRLYQIKSFRQLLMELLSWPDHRAVVVSFFVLLGYISLTGLQFHSQNITHFYYHLTSFLGLVLFFGIEFVVIAYLKEIHGGSEGHSSDKYLAFIFTLFFTISFRLTVPDYHNSIPHIIFCYTILIFLSGISFRSWSNVLCFLILVVAPMGSLFGLDPIWGNDFSPFPVKTNLAIPFLVMIWVLSFSYFTYRNQIVSWIKSLFG